MEPPRQRLTGAVVFMVNQRSRQLVIWSALHRAEVQPAIAVLTQSIGLVSGSVATVAFLAGGETSIRPRLRGLIVSWQRGLRSRMRGTNPHCVLARLCLAEAVPASERWSQMRMHETAATLCDYLRPGNSSASRVASRC